MGGNRAGANSCPMSKRIRKFFVCLLSFELRLCKAQGERKNKLCPQGSLLIVLRFRPTHIVYPVEFMLEVSTSMFCKKHGCEVPCAGPWQFFVFVLRTRGLTELSLIEGMITRISLSPT